MTKPCVGDLVYVRYERGHIGNIPLSFKEATLGIVLDLKRIVDPGTLGHGTYKYYVVHDDTVEWYHESWLSLVDT